MILALAFLLAQCPDGRCAIPQQTYSFQASGPEFNGKRVRVEMPVEEHLRNKGGSDGAGLCVFTSIDHAARYQNVPSLIGFRDFMTQYPGGSWPEKTDRMVKLIAASRKMPVPEYVQHTGGDMSFLEKALKTGRYPCVTYSGADGVFYRNRIAHMVNLVYLDEETAAIHDNNFPGKWLWMTRKEFYTRWLDMSGGWAFVLVAPSPPPLPMLEHVFMETPTVMVAEFQNYGIDLSKMPQGETWTKDGQPCTKFEAIAALDIPDDSGLSHLSIVGDVDFRNRVKNDLKEVDVKLRVQEYDIDHWRVRQSKLVPGVVYHNAANNVGRAKEEWVIPLKEYSAESLRDRLLGRKPVLPTLPVEVNVNWLIIAALLLALFRDKLLSLFSWLWSKVPSRRDETKELLQEILKELKK